MKKELKCAKNVKYVMNKKELLINKFDGKASCLRFG